MLNYFLFNQNHWRNNLFYLYYLLFKNFCYNKNFRKKRIFKLKWVSSVQLILLPNHTNLIKSQVELTLQEITKVFTIR